MFYSALYPCSFEHCFIIKIQNLVSQPKFDENLLSNSPFAWEDWGRQSLCFWEAEKKSLPRSHSLSIVTWNGPYYTWNEKNGTSEKDDTE